MLFIIETRYILSNSNIIMLTYPNSMYIYYTNSLWNMLIVYTIYQHDINLAIASTTICTMLSRDTFNFSHMQSKIHISLADSTSLQVFSKWIWPKHIDSFSRKFCVDTIYKNSTIFFICFPRVLQSNTKRDMCSSYATISCMHSNNYAIPYEMRDVCCVEYQHQIFRIPELYAYWFYRGQSEGI